MRSHRVVVTGYGGICSLGTNFDDIWRAVLAKKMGYTIWENPGKEIKTTIFGHIRDALSVTQFSKRIIKNTPRFARLGLIATDEAMTMAFGESQNFTDYYNEYDCGVIFGTGWGGFDDAAANYYAYQDVKAPSIQNCFHSMPSIGTAAITVNWQFKGYQNTPVAACASSNIAIGDAYLKIKNGQAKMMIAGGGESTMGSFAIWSIDVLSALTKEKVDLTKACCPFSLDRSGFILSEGAAVVCLEDLETAQKRGAPIFGEIIGYANYSDAYVNLTAPAPDLHSRTLTTQKAIEYANLNVQDIDYINAHGTSTPMNDLNETQVIKQVFGQRAYQIPISSTKSYTGHLIGAAGAMETLFCLKSLTDGVIPATINLNRPDPDCDLNYVPNEHLFKQNLNHVLNVNYGFGGANSCLVIERYQP
ncbi:beta-ketoacyl-[acyl-carrier-protein] synthase family protein [Utexia brackfieldae]|uniref:beta-ketoacyl-[acyl-carrier-protein] synthase family protein n=1 Tax=Utexia brackfieldae TaxID=3074108 RepID=UPI00370D6870